MQRGRRGRAPDADGRRRQKRSRPHALRLAEARQALSHLQHWVLAEPGLVRPGSGYRAALRMRLDTAELPKPFQASALASRDWTLASAWYRWTLAVPEPGP